MVVHRDICTLALTTRPSLLIQPVFVSRTSRPLSPHSLIDDCHAFTVSFCEACLVTARICSCRAQLDELTVAMSQLRTKYEDHAQAVAAAEVAALNMQQGAAELEAMREEQNALSQRIAFLQGLLQVLMLHCPFY